MANNPFDPPIIQVKKTLERGGLAGANRGFGSMRSSSPSSRPAPGPQTIDELDDVDTTDIENGNVLVWNEAEGLWLPGEGGGGGGGAGGLWTSFDVTVRQGTATNIAHVSYLEYLIDGAIAHVSGHVRVDGAGQSGQPIEFVLPAELADKRDPSVLYQASNQAFVSGWVRWINPGAWHKFLDVYVVSADGRNLRVSSDLGGYQDNTTAVDASDEFAFRLMIPLRTPGVGMSGAGDADWRVIGATGQPAFQNGWVNYQAPGANDWGANSAAFRKDAAGYVHLRGLIKSGTLNTPIFTLPVGYRPASRKLLSAISNSAIGRIDIVPDPVNGGVGSAGEVRTSGGSNAWYSLDSCAPFLAEA